ncbi:MAG: hypothetical protein IT513_12335 [Burkholderiales bacterium]|nr:hypothetical protein [Burkholderiales bacterium]
MSPEHRYAWTGATLLGALAIPPLRSALEASMSLHMLVQIPLLAAAGALLARALPARALAFLAACNERGIPGIVLALGISSYWMIPRALDAVLASGTAELLKFVSLPLLVGLPLALSWPRLGPIAKGFVAANWIPMLAVVGWLYLESPVRLCNYYLVDQQVAAGNLLVKLSILLAALWLATLFWRPALWTGAAATR